MREELFFLQRGVERKSNSGFELRREKERREKSEARKGLLRFLRWKEKVQ
jgi:hypothetical protein